MTSTGPTDGDAAERDGDDAGFNAGEQSDNGKEFDVEPLVPKKSGGTAAGRIALVFSVVALAAIGYSTVRDLRATGDSTADAAVEALNAALAEAQSAQRNVERQITEINDELAAVRDAGERQLASSNSNVDDRLRQLEAMPGRLASVEASLATLQGISTGARAAWLLAEAEYYMQIANAQLQLANNSELAKTALAHADERIVQLGDPRLTAVRQAITDELRALDLMETPDTAGITLTLASLANVVDSLPLRQQQVTGEDGEMATDADLSGVDRALASMKRTLGNAVKVRRVDEAMQPLIAPEAQYFLRANLALKLQIARLALLRGEENVFRQSLDDADGWLATYYDGSNTAVRSARDTLSDIKSNTLTVATPDISQSLRLLRQFNAVNRAADANVEAEQAQ